MIRTLLLALAVTSFAAGQERPNVVLILADDMGYSDVGCYGGEIATPHLDALAAGGLRFTQMYNTSKCFPSRACLLTGRYAQQVGMDRGPKKILDAPTLGNLLRSAGYHTFMSGKHHGTQNPFELGFERYFGLRDGASNHFNPGPRREGEPKPAQKRAKRAWCIDDKTHAPYIAESGFYTTDAFTDHALEFLETTRESERPFFLYLAYTAPHDPLMAWPADIATYSGRYDEGWGAARARRWKKQGELGLLPKDALLSEPDYPDWSTWTVEQRTEEARRMEVYAAMIDRLDQNVGRVLAKLRELEEFENTLILFASDNGSSAEVVRIGQGEIGSMERWASLQKRWANVSNTPFRRYKNHSYEGGICTPLIAHWPEGITARGTLVREPAHFVDLFPTLAELCGAPPLEAKAPLAGQSIAALLRGGTFQRAQPLFWHWSGGRAVRDGRWKAVRWGDQAWELYDIDADRTEQKDLASEQALVLGVLTKAWEQWSLRGGTHPSAAADATSR
ncbi:MAG: arylsulfatase A-like enzyme [Planctomycetota bacterium]|jgi:arylsulfatase A-like enzyme